jgi:hypothetical protein
VVLRRASHIASSYVRIKATPPSRRLFAEPSQACTVQFPEAGFTQTMCGRYFRLFAR